MISELECQHCQTVSDAAAAELVRLNAALHVFSCGARFNHQLLAENTHSAFFCDHLMSGTITRVGTVLAVLFGLWLAFDLGRRSGMIQEEHQNVFVLAVGLKFKSVADRDELLKTWRHLAAHTRQHEPGTLSYKWLVADNDPTKVLVYERYVQKDAYTGPHRHSKPFFAFKEAQKKLQIEITGQSYIETPDGFM